MLETQIHVGSRAIYTDMSAAFPRYGWRAPNAFWTSTKTEKGSGWIAFQPKLPYTHHSPNKRYVHELTPDPNARILTISTIEDWKQTFPKDGSNPDWEKIQQGYDAVRVLPEMASYTTWDCESTAWFRWCFAESRLIGRLVKASTYARRFIIEHQPPEPSLLK